MGSGAAGEISATKTVLLVRVKELLQVESLHRNSDGEDRIGASRTWAAQWGQVTIRRTTGKRSYRRYRKLSILE